MPPLVQHHPGEHYDRDFVMDAFYTPAASVWSFEVNFYPKSS
jgi:hypothetical protein